MGVDRSFGGYSETPASTAPPARQGASRWPRLGSFLVLLCVGLPVVLMVAGAATAWRDTWSTARAELRQGAAGAAEYGLRVLTLHAVAAGRIDALLRGLTDAEIRAREAELHAELRGLVDEIPGTEAAYVVDRHGAVLVSANFLPVTRQGRPAADQDFFLALSAENPPGVHVSRVHVGPVNGTLFFAVSRRRTQVGNGDVPAGAFDGLVNLSVFSNTLAEGLRNLRQRPGDVAGLVRADGELLARSVGQTGPMPAHETLVAAMASGAEEMVTDHVGAVDGVRRLHAAHRVEGWPVYGVAGRPHADILAEWRRRVAEQLAIGVPATLLLLGLALAVRRSHAELERRVAARTAELAASEARLHAALNAGRVYAFEYHPGAGLVLRSPSAASILGLPDRVARRDSGTAFLAAVHPEDLGKVRAALEGASPERPGYAVRFRYVRPDGDVVWLEDAGCAQFDAQGRMTRLTSLARDITVEVEAEAAAEQAGLRLRAAAEGAGVGTYEIDLLRRIAWFDARAAQLVGNSLPAETWVAMGGVEWMAFEAAIHPEDRAAYAAAWEDVASGAADGWTLESRLRGADGAWRWLWCHGLSLERDARTGRPARVVGMLLDVTDRRNLEDELRQAQKLQALGQLAGGIAHDVNNVLQAISGSAAMAGREAADPKAVHRRLAAVAAAVSRGAAITHRLLAFARRGERQPETIDPAMLLAGLREILAPGLGPRIKIRIEAADNLPGLLADREALQTVLINLATNARDAMPEGGVLTLSALSEDGGVRPLPASPGRWLRMSVRDTGTGMDAATLARVAEPFFTTKLAGKGTGLGVSMARSFAEAAGGRFAIESTPGQGTTVTLWLPLAGPAEAEAEGARPGAETARRGCRVLLVDDEPVVRTTLAEQLEAAGCHVVAEGDAAAALAMLDTGRPVDAIVADMAMPGMDGVTLIREAQARRPGLPAVLITGHADPADLADTLPEGSLSATFRKPVAIADLVACLGGMARA